MADAGESGNRSDAGAGIDHGYTGAPRWVKILGVIALVLALLVAVMLLTGIGGEHGPGRHSSVTGVQPS